MKKKQKHIEQEMGVSIRGGAVLLGENKYLAGNYLVGLLLFMMMMVGMAECLVQGFSLVCMQKWLLVGILVSCLMFYTGFSRKKGGEILVALYLIGYGIASYLMRKYIANGLAVFVNTVLKKAGKYYHVTFTFYEEYADLNRKKSLTIFLLFVFVFFIGILSYFVVHKIATYFAVSITFVVAFASEVIGLVPGKKAMALYTLSVLIYIVSGIKYKNKKVLPASELKVQWKVQLIQIVTGIACILLFFQVFTEATYDKISRETDLKAFVQKAIQTCYNNTIRRGLDKGTVDGGISFGDISGVDSIKYSDTVRLRVKYKTLDMRQRANGGLYLRGYIGSKYEGSQWLPLSEGEEKKCRKMEQNSGISLDDYDTATASYRMALEEYLEYEPKNAIFTFHEGTTEKFLMDHDYTEGETDFLYQKYDSETFCDRLKSICSVVFSDIIVENVSETVSTQFVPYYAVSDVKEEEGRLISKETTDVGEYEWNIFNGQAEAFGVVTDPYNTFNIEYNLDYYDKTKILWREFLDIKENVEAVSGQKLLDYEEGSYKGKSIKEVCPKLAEKLKVTIFNDTSMCIEEVNTDGEYDINELIRRIARYSSSTLRIMSSDNHTYEYSGLIAGSIKAADSSSSSITEIYMEDESDVFSNEYNETLEKEYWEKIYGSESIVRQLHERGDADQFFSLLKQMYRFYIQQQEYENFIEDTYLDVPENLNKILGRLMKEEGMDDAKDLRQIIAYVQNYLSENTEYTLEPGTTPDGEDFIEYFLFKNRKGYCVHYATAATMLFRSMGIPARYVEGYRADKDTLHEQDVVSMEGASLWHTVDLTDRYAHAWVEIYISGYGWIPVEVTKAYLNLEENENTSKTPVATAKSAEKSTKKPSSTINPTNHTAAPQSGATQEKVDYTPYYKICYVILGLAVILAVTALRYLIITKRHQRQEGLEDANKVVYFYYTRMEQILRLQKKCGKKQCLRQLLKEQAISLDGVDVREWLHFYETMNDYTYSKEGVTKHQVEEVKRLYEMVRNAYYREKKIWMCWYYKYIRCI